MIDFNTCLDGLEVRDLRYHGPPFTFPQSLAQFLPPVISDHTPAVVALDTMAPVAGTKPFKFFNYLTAHPDFISTVLEGWEVSPLAAWSLS